MYIVAYPTVRLDTGGAEQQLLELVRGLDKRRFRPVVVPLYGGGTLEAEFRGVPGVEVVCLDRRHRFDFSVIWKLVALLRSRQVDIVQPFVSPASVFGLLAGVLAGTSVKIATERGGARRHFGIGPSLYLFAARRLMRFADLAVANSEAGGQLLRRAGLPESRVRVIVNGINPSRLHASPERVAAHRRRFEAGDAAWVVGILANLKPAKGQDTFLRAAAEIAAQHPDARFAIVGEGPSRQELESLADDLGIRDRVVFFGFQQQVAEFLGLFDVLVSASRDNEGHSNSILEAMALGVPVVATDIGGSRELVEHGRTGRLVPIDDPQQLAAAIVAVRAERKRTGDMVARARERVASQFTLERMVSSYAALYEEVLDPSMRSLPICNGEADPAVTSEAMRPGPVSHHVR